MWRSRRRATGLVWAAVAALLLLTAGPAAAAAPELQLEPATGQPGDTFTVTGVGFDDGVVVELHWDDESGPLLGAATGPGFSLEVTVPADAEPNSHPVVAVVRDGDSLSTSNASFQVVPDDQPAEPEPSIPTTAADPGTPDPPPAGRGGFGPADGGPTGSPRGGLGVTGGVGGDATEPVIVTTPGQPGTGSAQDQQAAGTAAARGDGATTTTGVPTVGGPPGSPGASAESNAAGAAGSGPSAEERSGAALSPGAASQSSEAVRSPALLLVGLAMVFGGGVVLAVRNRQRAPEIDGLQ